MYGSQQDTTMVHKRNFEGINILDAIKSSIDESNELVIPEFQRGFAWSIKDVAALFESVFSGFPIGSILTWTPHKKTSMTFKPIRGDPNESKNSENSICDYYCQHPRHISQDTGDKKYLLDGQQRMRSLYYGLLFSCHQEIFRPKKTKTQPFTFIVYTDNGRDFEVAHHNDLINQRYQDENILILNDIKLVRYGETDQIELIFHYFDIEKDRSKPTVWKYAVELVDEDMGDPIFKGFIVDEARDIHQPTNEVLTDAFKKCSRGVLIPSFVHFNNQLENYDLKPIWDYFYDIVRTLPTDIDYSTNQYSNEEKIRLTFEHKTIFKFFSNINKLNRNLTSGLIGEINISGPLNEMVVIFDKLNMSGVRLSTMDLLVAKTYADEPDNFNLRNILSQFDDDDEILNFFGKEQFLGDKIYLLFLKAIALIYKEDLREKSMLDLSRDQLKTILIENKEEFTRAIHTTIEFFRSIPKLPHISYVRYETQIAVLIAIMYNIYNSFPNLSGIRIENIIRNHFLSPWYWRIVFPSKFSSNTRENARRQYIGLNSLIQEIAQSIIDKTYQNRRNDFERTLDRITTEYKLPSFDEISELPDGRSYTPINLLPFSENGSSPNLNSGISDSLSNTTKSFQVHHIFPFNLHKTNPQITKLLIDHPLNMIIIDGGLNSHISNKYPDDYFREFKENYEKLHDDADYIEDILTPNFIPELILDFDRLNLRGIYQQFLHHRYETFKEYLMKLQKRNWSVEDEEIEEDLSLEDFEISGNYLSTEHFLPKSHVRDILREESGMNVQGHLVDYLSSHCSMIILSILKDHPYDITFRSYWIENFNVDLEFIQLNSRIGSEALFERIRKFAGCKKNPSLTDYIRKAYYYLLKQIGQYLQHQAKKENMKTLMRRELPDLTLTSLKNDIFVSFNPVVPEVVSSAEIGTTSSETSN